MLYESGVGIAINEDDDELKAALEEALANLEESGELTALLEEYGLPAADDAVVTKALAGQD